MRPPEAPEELKKWIERQCELRGWSYREASLNAGLSHNMISLIMGGRVPSVETCRKLAKAFNVTPEFVMFKAGLLASDPTADVLTPEVEGLIRRIERLPEGSIRDAAIDALNTMLDAIIASSEDNS